MKVEITEESKNPLLGRKEVSFRTADKVTPSRSELKAELSKSLKKDEKLIVIDVVKQMTGSNIIGGKAKVYNNEKDLAKIELDYKNKRGVKEKKEDAAPAEEKKPAEPAAEAQEEAPAEAPKEESKAPQEESAEAPAEEKKEEALTEEKSE
jgi:ribosomal protein S24E